MATCSFVSPYFQGRFRASRAGASEERLSPGGFRQINGILASNGLSLTQGYVRVERVSGSASYYAYAVINDQMTSDGSFIPPISQLDSDETSSLMIPAVVRSGAFSSEVILANWRPETKRLKLRFVSEEFYAIEASIDVELAPRQQLVIPDIIQFLRERGAAGLNTAGVVRRITVRGKANPAVLLQVC